MSTGVTLHECRSCCPWQKLHKCSETLSWSKSELCAWPSGGMSHKNVTHGVNCFGKQMWFLLLSLEWKRTVTSQSHQTLNPLPFVHTWLSALWCNSPETEQCSQRTALMTLVPLSLFMAA